MSATDGRILVVGTLKPSLHQRVTGEYRARVLPDGPDRAEFLSQFSDDVEIVLTTGKFGVSADLMAALPRLRVIINFGVGYDATDVAAAAGRGIVVTNTPDVLTDCVADTAVALVLDTLRGFSAADRWVRAGHWPELKNFPLTRRVSGSRVGIVGLGRIGTAIAHRLTAFGCTIGYHNRREVTGSEYRYHADPVALAAASDVLVVAAAGGPASVSLVGRDVLDALGPRGFLVNVARGSVVDQDALLDALTEGRLAGAGLDVFAREPEVPAELLDRDDVVLLPHLASGTVETREDMERLVLDNLDAYLSEGRVLTPVPETPATGNPEMEVAR